ncbi:MAG TPA: hypothetical protein VJU60_09890 [Thermoleophilaceae bacterium]|nr:hypothetical protein [Thermoleophilaceae bacterium]
MSYGGRIRIGALASGVAAAALLVAGCGGGKNFADQPRPAATLMLSGVITNSGVTVSPSHAGAGPLKIQVSNQTRSSHTLELDGANIQPVQSGSIAPTNTGSIQITLKPGVYTVKAGSATAVKKELAPARLVIGKARQDSNDQVGLP